MNTNTQQPPMTPPTIAIAPETVATDHSPGDPNTAAVLNVDGSINVPELIALWDAATSRLQETHESLSREVAKLTDELEIKNRELARKNRLADLGLVASHIAHEVRNSLMPLTLYTGMLRRQMETIGEDTRVVTKIESGLTILNSTVNDLLHFTADRRPQISSVSLRPLIEEICQQLQPQMTAQRVRLVCDVAAGIVVPADKEMLRRACLNLTLNALDVMPEGGCLTITGTVVGSRVEIEFADTGCGISDFDAAKLFDPFFTTKNTGTGLGLAIVQRVVESHEGHVTARNCPDYGAAFTLVLPHDAQQRKEAA